MRIADLLETLRRESGTTVERGHRFELLIRAFLRTDPYYRQLFRQVWLWMDWPDRGGRRDTGIDLVAEEAGTGALWAIQCKFWDHPVNKHDLDSFFTESGKHPFAARLVVATADLTTHAQEAFRDQQVPVHTLTLADLDHSPVDWAQVTWPAADPLPLRPRHAARPHQVAAVEAVVAGFRTTDRGQLLMACGTGKTLTSLRIAERMIPGAGQVLVLCPSLALVSQALREWTAEAERPLRCFAVCSDARMGRTDEDLRPSDLAFPATTDPAALAAAVRRRLPDAGQLTVLFATYQSLAVVTAAQQTHGLGVFDLVISDEAHRTVGAALTAKGVPSGFTAVHDPALLRAHHRLYMTATPRIYAPASKAKAADQSVTLYSMDDPAIFGPVFHRLSFSAAVDAGILADYKVIVLHVNQAEALAVLGDAIHNAEDLAARVDDVAKVIGCVNAFQKRFPAADREPDDDVPMRRVVAFSNKIQASQRATQLFQQVQAALPGTLQVSADHVDGSMNVAVRNRKLDALRDPDLPADACRVLSNARCLSEGVDVPALDAVVFLQPRDSQIDVVQAVGRVMRTAPGKTLGYVVLPVVVPSDLAPEVALEDSPAYKVVWQVLNALRAHDDRFRDLVNQLEFNQRSRKIRVIGRPGARTAGDEDPLDAVSAHAWQKLFYAKVVQRVGERAYWDEWARKVAHVVGTYTTLIQDILARDTPDSRATQAAFAQFLAGLRANVNDSVTMAEAVDMVAQHLVTQPVFDALFTDYPFMAQNPVAQALQPVIDCLAAHALWKEKQDLMTIEGRVLGEVRKEVERQAAGIDNGAGKQEFIRRIYDRFFAVALKQAADRLGIVYTPVEVVDFILHSVDAVLQDEFGTRLTAADVHILDPFVGTGTFLVRLLQTGLVEPADLLRKYRHELHANEIVLLAYYLAATNIEATFHGIAGTAYEPFPGIVLTDTFQQGEDLILGAEAFAENNARLARQQAAAIRVIVGNPPYSGGQGSENDNNKNLRYAHLDRHIRDTYAAQSTAKLKNSLYDSYIRAFRWASDRIGRQGVIGFVTNGSFLDSNSADGLRKTWAQEFSAIYCWNLRGNARTQGEDRRREKDNVFGSGSRAPIAITLLVKNPAHRSPAVIHYADIGDYLDRETKLARIAAAESVHRVAWEVITPNAAGDWIHPRSDAFAALMPLGDPDPAWPAAPIFRLHSSGVKTNRDPWTYNFSHGAVADNMRRMMAVYNEHVAAWRAQPTGAHHSVDAFVDPNPKKISWTRELKRDVAVGRDATFQPQEVVHSLYRPYTKQWLYFDRQFNNTVYQMPRVFPGPHLANRVITVTGAGASRAFSTLMTDVVPNYDLSEKSQCFPLYYYEEGGGRAGQRTLAPLGTEDDYDARWMRHEAISPESLALFRSRYGVAVTAEDVFYYVYGVLHAPDYRTAFADDLTKQLPRIPLVGAAEAFRAFSQAGRALGDLHVGYESVEPWPVDEVVTRAANPRSLYHVTKMRWGKAAHGGVDRTVIHYNDHVTLRGIPLAASDYVVNGKAALDWVIDRYQVSTDKASGLVNDPNAWSPDPRYIVDLVKRVVRISMETQAIVEGLPQVLALSGTTLPSSACAPDRTGRSQP